MSATRDEIRAFEERASGYYLAAARKHLAGELEEAEQIRGMARDELSRGAHAALPDGAMSQAALRGRLAQGMAAMARKIREADEAAWTKALATVRGQAA